jgi:hypothetical protein
VSLSRDAFNVSVLIPFSRRDVPSSLLNYVDCTPLWINQEIRGKIFPEPENEEVLTEYHALQLVDPRAVEEIENGIWALMWNASRRILLRNKQHKAPKPQVKSRRNRLKWIEARSCVQSKVGNDKSPKIKKVIQKVIAKMSLHSGKDKMALVLLTLEHMENLRTMHAITQYRDGLGGGPCVYFSTTRSKRGARGQCGARARRTKRWRSTRL